MELKHYQQKALDEMKRYLELLALWQKKARKAAEAIGDEGAIDYPKKAWEEFANGYGYISRKNGLGQHLPNCCLKIPTGGGKTLLAAKAIDLINTIFRSKRTGLVLWVVPSVQIYRQTLNALRDKAHSYRQHLDLASGGKTLILEKSARFTPLDMEENLCVLLLMLPSAARQTKETLRMFRDSGGFQEFFPTEDSREAQGDLLRRFPNLDCYEDTSGGFFGKQIKTSLGNTLRLLSPLIILDEGHKAYSDIAQDTLRGFNPCFVLELSATPPDASNILVEIYGTELHREGMIKLDLHIYNKASTDWKDTLTESVAKRNELEKAAKTYEVRTGIYIRPICLIQAERTGRDQRQSGRVHSEDVRERLIKAHNIDPAHIAVKTSEKDELKEIDDTGGLLIPDCNIRYIITKQALQEGWDCSFAYVLSILANPAAQNSLTQLVGRILRQPYARKTDVQALDESYVFCFQQRGRDLLRQIESGFQGEGLGDLRGRMTVDEGKGGDELGFTTKTATMRKKFQPSASRCIFPIFAMKEGTTWRQVHVPMDIESKIDWQDADLKPLYELSLSERESMDTEHIATLTEDLKKLVEEKNIVRLKEGTLHVDAGFLTRHLIDVVPNPWIAYDMGKKILSTLLKRCGERLVTHNFVSIIERARAHLFLEQDRLSRKIFEDYIRKGSIRFFLIGDELSFRFPKTQTIRTASLLNRRDNTLLQNSLFDAVPSEDFNEFEEKVALYLDSHERLFFWYRNRVRQDYYVQGWRKERIYPDFIFTGTEDKKAFDKVFVVETKGTHLLGNEDTKYKEQVFSLCNSLAKEGSLNQISKKDYCKKIHFEMVPETAWEESLESLFACH